MMRVKKTHAFTPEKFSTDEFDGYVPSADTSIRLTSSFVSIDSIINFEDV